MKPRVYKKGESWVTEFPATPTNFYYWDRWEWAMQFALTGQFPTECSFEGGRYLVLPLSIWVVS